MKILIDTHILLWYLTDNPKLSERQADLIEDSSNELFVSIISLWDIAIKRSIGKLKFEGEIESIIPEDINLLQVLPSHISLLESLPNFHKDPFDKKLICQAAFENFTLSTNDQNIKKYNIETF